MKNDRSFFSKESHTCYKQNVSEQKSVLMNIKCNTTTAGNQVRITLLKKYSQLVLCDVRIYGGKIEGYICKHFGFVNKQNLWKSFFKSKKVLLIVSLKNGIAIYNDLKNEYDNLEQIMIYFLDTCGISFKRGKY
jgi:hypothetical protein